MLISAWIRELTLISPPAGLHGPQAQIQERIQDLRPARSDLRTGEQSNQGMPGFAALSVEGLEKVNGEWHLIAATHNLLKQFRHRRSQQQALVAATG